MQDLQALKVFTQFSEGKFQAAGALDRIQDAVGRILLAALAVSGLAAQTPAGSKLEFDVASVKPSKVPLAANFPLDAGGAKTPGGRLSASAPLGLFISFAYKLLPSEGGALFAQLPKSISADFYEIEARAEGNPGKDQMRLMMQSLLADRFKLAVHFETREAPVFGLTLVKAGKTGPKLRPHSEGPPCSESFTTPLWAGDVFPPNCEDLWWFREKDEMRQVGLRDATMPLAAEAIYRAGRMAGEVDKPVVDETGLEGKFDFVMQFTPGENDRLTRAPPPDPSGVPFQNALRDQLGLKLKSSRAPIRAIVIDHVERPSEN
jgi:uncharacterized protein (TIGR03435 family)